MPLDIPQFQPEEIDQAGRVLVNVPGEDEDDSEWLEAAHVVNRWRAAHAHPLNTFRVSLRRRAGERVLIAQRLKRLSSIVLKLERLSWLKLSDMQDIGGCRVVVGRASRAVNLAAEVIGGTRHELVGFRNYIEKPRDSGYRGIHLVYAYNSARRRELQGLKTELQIRSGVQHQWATAVETVGTFIGEDLKSGQGDKAWLRFFSLTSSVIALQEGTPGVPNTPTNQSELRDEIKACDQVIGGVYGRLAAFQRVTRRLAPFAGGNYWVLIEMNLDTRSLNGRAFRPSDWEEANAAYLDRELETRGNPQIDVALVSTNSLTALRKAYPNYFADLTQFIASVRRVIS